MVLPSKENTIFYTQCPTCGNSCLGPNMLIKGIDNKEKYVTTIFFPYEWHGFISKNELQIVSPDGCKFIAIKEDGNFSLKFRMNKSPIISRREHVCPQSNKEKKYIGLTSYKDDREESECTHGLYVTVEKMYVDVIIPSNKINEFWKRQTKKKFTKIELPFQHTSS